MPVKNIPPINGNGEILDQIAKECGEVVSQEMKEKIVVKEGEERDRYVDEYLDQMKSKPALAYGDSGPIPGQDLSDVFSAAGDISKEDALNSVIVQNAMKKVKDEAAAARKLTPEQKAANRQQTIDAIMYRAEEEYFIQHKYVMDGRTKRRTRAQIARDYDKGRYNTKPKTGLNG